jgi:ATP-binding cassette, subfamily B, bacterial
MRRWNGSRVVAAWRDHVQLHAELLPKAGLWLLATTALAEIVVGLLPVAVMLAISAAVAGAPGAAAAGPGSPAASRVIVALLLAVGAFCLTQLLSPLTTALGSLMQLKVDGYCIERLMRGALLRAPYPALEESRVLDPLTDAFASLESGWATPGAACAALMALTARYAQLAGALALVAGLYSGWLAALLLAVALLIRHGRRGWQRRERQLWRDLGSARRKVLYLRRLGTGPAAAKEIRVFGLIGWIRAHYRSDADAFLGPLAVRRRKIGMKPFIYYSGLAFAVGAVALVLLVHGFAQGQLSLFEFVLFLQVLRMALLFGDSFPECDDNLTFGYHAYNAMLDFEQAAGPAPTSGPQAPARRVTGQLQAIRFEHVDFRYGCAGPLVLRDLSFTMPAGTSTAIVGLNGAGKTTLIKLLAKLYEPTAGRIMAGETDLADIPPVSWHGRIAVIFQDFNRYQLSAGENIGFGSIPHLGDTEGICAAAGKAGVLAAIESLPQGLQTPLSRQYPGGADLSGGQWQRVALARVMFAVRHGAQVLVLDEPTAQLDARAEVEFFDRFLDLTRGTTSVVISHRFSTVRRADRILVLENGSIAESGTHDELLRLDGRYAELFRAQAQPYAADQAGVVAERAR